MKIPKSVISLMRELGPYLGERLIVGQYHAKWGKDAYWSFKKDPRNSSISFGQIDIALSGQADCHGQPETRNIIDMWES